MRLVQKRVADDCEIALFGDAHLGSVACHVKGIREAVAWVLQEPNRYWAGMGDMIKGWISTGPNPAITGDQLSKVLGNEQVASIAKQLGVDPAAAMGQLSSILPGLVDKMTPDGTVPQNLDIQGQLGGLLGGLFGKK